ncbi:Por secretion system C-terminal sorting domain-containing protein [Aquimarina amphilecti]|uniref:Por secretion system C-terminal sorting domain-containing protein n=1 Tax=Aquimarina amphilecti TaxID=1038014 RepID=A0A1H7VDT0_AQUAM|nr:DUF1501 domain-containing protein [Aquimarina amphilecti]SEM06927.1 Por secretion system C-terminal sorting domain-containing protein [Aquimarina amphilecti]
MCDTHQPKNIKSTSKEGACNPDEHKKWNRRSFLQALGLVGGGSMMLANTNLTVSRPSPLSMALSQAETDNILIICRLGGGNDGYNTIIPVNQYDIYANARPLIKIPPSEFINLEENEYAMPKPMNKLENLWGDGQMKVAHGVGYEDQTLSHFRGTDIWANTNLTEEERSGFMGRYFQRLHPSYITDPPPSPPSIQIGSIGNLIFRGPENDFSFAISDPRRLEAYIENQGYSLDPAPDCTYGDRLNFIRESTNVTYTYAEAISEAFNRSTDFGGYLEDDSFARQMRIVARLIKGNLGTKVYMVTLGGFDTHNNQIQRHQQLLNSFSEGISNFYADLQASGWDDKVLTMTISEFGRRLVENGSLGTDHGTVAPMMFFGTGLNGNGFIGEHPDLPDSPTVGFNAESTNDFRQIYSTVMKEWLCIDPSTVSDALLGEEFESLDLGFTCGGVSPNIPGDGETLSHIVTYDGGQTFININNPETTHVDITLFNIIGQKVATLRNEMLLEGEHVIDVKESSGTRLSTGQYVYRIETGAGEFSKSLLIS